MYNVIKGVFHEILEISALLLERQCVFGEA